MDKWIFRNACPNSIQNLFFNSTLLEQPLLLYIIVTALCSECNNFVCNLCKGNWRIFIMFVMCLNTDITLFDVPPVDFHIVVSICCTVLVPKSQGMEQLMYNYSVHNAQIYAVLEVQLLALWKIEKLWLTVARQQRCFFTTRSLIVACISAEATTSSQTCWSQQNMSVINSTHFMEGQRSVEEECMACLWTDKYINKFVFRSHFNRCTTGGVTQTYCCTIP